MAWISPASKLRSTAFSAWVAPNRLSSPCRARSGAPGADTAWFGVITGSVDLRVEQFLGPLAAHVVLGDQVGAGVDVGRHRLALGGGERRLDAVIAHPE